jgi:hypothetical protein
MQAVNVHALITGYDTVGDHTEFIVQVPSRAASPVACRLHVCRWEGHARRLDLPAVSRSRRSVHGQISCNGGLWRISRRFSDFDQVHARLLRRFGDLIEAQLPEKQWFGRFVALSPFLRFAPAWSPHGGGCSRARRSP